MTKIFTSLVGLLIVTCVHGQDCQRHLIEARRAYLNGNFDQVKETLILCVKEFENPVDRKEALELLINSYLVLEEIEAADSLMFQLLDNDPLYSYRSSDIIEFQYLVDSYEIKRKFTTSFVIGLNSANYQVMQYRSYASITEEPSNYYSKPGPYIGLEGDWYLNDKFFLSTGIGLQSSSYSQTETILTFQEVFISERLTYLKVPFQMGTSVQLPTFRAFAKGGISAHYLISSRADFTLYGRDPDFPNPLNGLAKKTENYRLGEQRKHLTFNYLLTTGIQKTFGLYGVEVSIQYEFGLNNLVKEEGRYADDQLLGIYSYVPDDFKMNNLQFRLGISRFFVKPAKKEQ